jgi:hypothetical protein
VIDLPNGKINNVFYVLGHSTNFLSIFQITHSSDGKIVKFSPHDVVIEDLKDLSIVIASGYVDDSSRMYKFDNFEPSFPTTIFIAHVDDLRKIWHDWFGHMNYH